ncbi:MAG: imidazole glycerol phosphate synthase subunit HisH [Sedimentisphaerales bacterium]|nr:imidazole glycerol phosphate synthase subunit HisH [Sedimentisphaerales bacterium]
MITIIDYKAGNLTSVQLAFEYIGIKVQITDKPADVLKATQVVFPGVGAAGAAMENLRNLKIIDPIKKIISDGVPFLGICIGIQLLLDFSEEDGGTQCLGVIPGKAKRFQPADPMCKIPQMGWNAVKTRPHPLFGGIENESEFYFVHSYYPAPERKEMIVGETDYADVTFASAVACKNLAAVQFHPERSGRIGLKLLENFSRWGGTC